MSDLKQFNAVIRSTKTQEYLADVLGERKSTFVSNLTALVSNDRKLQECEPLTLMYAALTATSLNLPLDKNLGYAYVIPYKNSRAGISEAQFQLGAKGITQLAIRSGEYERINVGDVREGELAGRNRLTGDIKFNWIEDDKERQAKPIIGYVAYFRMNGGFSKTLYMSVEEIDEHAKRYSKTYGRSDSKWTTDRDAMAQKTVLKRLLSKFGALSVELATAIRADQSVQRGYGEYSYVDNDRTEIKEQLAELAMANAAKVTDAEFEEVKTNNENLFDDEND